MSEKPQDWDRSRDEIISGEYVLGVLSETDRRRVEARIATDPKFAMQVRRWQENLADFNDDYQEVKPSPLVHAKIEQHLFGDANDARPARVLQALWGSVFFWRGLAAAALVAAVGIGVAGRSDFLGTSQPEKPLVAELTGMDSPMSLLATYDFASGRLSVTPAALRQDQPKSLEVWLIEDGKPPASLGVLPDSGRGDIVIEASFRDAFTTGKTIAITVEPLGGSPSGKPTGPMIAFGKTKLL
ncbi:anti-sigma factor [Rhizobium sp. KVB221]|uniref:Anti-sigma factor n=1 Tax=Rhizobium setariae TaxID=2801340 RepID=A0A937CLK4_9HYPH|nr:anti-sigma factor [Rhizobium setariae]MBL0371751.1 anti-sigma factor [Rhizobium setariae]